MKIALLAALFFLTALLYASVGFGGGSTYTALLVISGIDYRLVPVLALTCNILVVSSNVWRYRRVGLVDIKKIWPMIIVSVPAAWLGGRLHISETLFIGLLWAALLFAGTRLLLNRQTPDIAATSKKRAVWLSPLIGGGIGFYAGLVGIGGGIFLAPVLHFMRWGSAKHIAAACSLFILVNSISGIWGQMIKLGDLSIIDQTLAYWPMLPAVIIGGLIGNHIGITRLSDALLKRLTGGLIVFVALRLVWRWAHLVL
ncbi:MAG: sulfite exporter TauE/SafE family protein [Alphaproteobacteria bacterium]